MSETISVKVMLQNGLIVECVITFSGYHECQLSFFNTELEQMNFYGIDLFAAFTALRESLEKNGAQLLCAGARPDVYPSSMSRDMGGGRKANVTRLGEQASMSDLVDIFDYAAPETVGSVDEQKIFHEKWTGWFYEKMKQSGLDPKYVRVKSELEPGKLG